MKKNNAKVKHATMLTDRYTNKTFIHSTLLHDQSAAALRKVLSSSSSLSSDSSSSG